MSLLILGVGDVLLGVEGVGVHVARRLEPLAWPPGVTAVPAVAERVRQLVTELLDERRAS